MTTDRAICTIIAKNYLASARTLAQSFFSFHPDTKCYVLIVDDFEGYINPVDECFEIVRLSELQIPNLRSFCFKYNITELCTAVKARLIEYLISEKSIDRLLYLDPDILVTGSLGGLFGRLGTHDIVLTPHLDADYPDDELLPDDGFILRAGLFNLGFIGVNASENARSFLSWWKPKLYERCVNDVANGYFVDQKFVDFVPLLFKNFFVEQDIGYNVAYWNLHSRKIGRENGSWRCNDGPLFFFHFSGYQPDGAALTSHIPISSSRHQLSTRNALGELFADYKEILFRNGYRLAISWPYSFDYFKSGEVIPDDLRVYYRSLPERWRSFGDPFDSEELKSQADVLMKSKTHTEQLNAILNSRAWLWVSRYGRFKNRYLTPGYQTLRRVMGINPPRRQEKAPSDRSLVTNQSGVTGETRTRDFGIRRLRRTNWR